jgi:hypothetical protein
MDSNVMLPAAELCQAAVVVKPADADAEALKHLPLAACWPSICGHRKAYDVHCTQ